MVKTKTESWLNALLKRLEIPSPISLSGRKIIAAQLSWCKVANASLSKQLVLITFTHVEIQNILSFGFNEVEQHGFFIHQDRKKFFISIGPRMVSNHTFDEDSLSRRILRFETLLRIFLKNHMGTTVCRPVCGHINMIMMASKSKIVFTLAVKTMELQGFIMAMNWRTTEISGKV